MISDRALRIALWLSVPLNLLGTAIFTGAALGHPSALVPLAPPPFYAAQLGLVIGLFAGVYAWLAMQRDISRPLLLVGAIGKVGFFALFVTFWIAGDLELKTVLRASPDLVLGAIYAGWLLSATPRPA